MLRQRRTERYFQNYPVLGDEYEVCSMCNKEPCSCWDVRRLLSRAMLVLLICSIVGAAVLLWDGPLVR